MDRKLWLYGNVSCVSKTRSTTGSAGESEVWVRCQNQSGPNNAWHAPWSPLDILSTGMECAQFLQIC